MDKIKFQMESPILLKSNKLFVLDEFTFLFVMYLAMKFSKFLMFLVSDAIYLIDLWRDIRWKLLLQRSSLVGEFRSYGSWMLMMLLSLLWDTISCGSCLLWFTLKTCLGLEWIALLFPFCGLVLPNVSVALLKCNIFSCFIL